MNTERETFMNKAKMEFMFGSECKSSYFTNSVAENVGQFNTGEQYLHWSDCQATG